jgi:hypothetical protein
MNIPRTTSTKALAMGILPNGHHKPYLPIQEKQQFPKLQNVKHHVQRIFRLLCLQLKNIKSKT